MFNVDYYFYNRPVSPHLSVYSTQFSSTLSILHRFSGLLLLKLLISFLFALSIVHNLMFKSLIIFLCSKYLFIYLSIYLIFNFSFLFHALNGFRYILFALNAYSGQKVLIWFSSCLLFIYMINVCLYIFWICF